MLQSGAAPQVRARQLLDNRVPPPVLAVGTAIVMVVLSRLSSPFAISAGLRYAVVGALLLFAAVMGGRAFAAFARARTTINPVNIDAASTLVTAGVYRVSRNPMYVSLTSLLLAVAVFLANAWAFAGPVLFALFINRFQIVPEERVMQAKFGQAFIDYRTRVRRWL